ncbi:hypothetical protein [Methylomonas koyamae]|uniref:hypothetical protein n=1 Tax=Methylomonas koyamae TaxID=702114 RepID=UPI0016430647|nr:hypothetical protein [Methylomonas koyamae]
MSKLSIKTTSVDQQNGLIDALQKGATQVPNTYDVVQSADNTVDIYLHEDTDAAIELLVRILAANPIYLGTGVIAEQPLAEGIKRAAKLISGRQAQLDAAIDAQVGGNFTSATSLPRPPRPHSRHSQTFSAVGSCCGDFWHLE